MWCPLPQDRVKMIILYTYFSIHVTMQCGGWGWNYRSEKNVVFLEKGKNFFDFL